MYTVKTDQKKNRLYIILGKSNQNRIRAYVEEIEQACRELVPGFTCLAALQNDGMLRQEDEDILFSTEDLLYAYGVSKIVRVRKNRSVFDRDRHSILDLDKIVVQNAKTICEAEEILDGWNRN